MEIQILELKKIPEDIKNGEEILNWMKFLSGQRREEFERMAKTNEYLEEAYNTLIKLSADDEKRLEYEARERALMDYNTQMKSAREQGLKEGEQRVCKVFRLYMQGQTSSEIAESCDMKVDEVERILFEEV